MNAKDKLMAILAVAIVAISAVAMSVPVMGENATTQAVVTGSGTPPVVEEKFELNDDGDPLHVQPGTQVVPVPDANKEVCTYVVAWDPNGASNINRVWITVHNPINAQVASGDTLAGTIVELNYTEAVVATQAAYDQGLITDARRVDINEHIYNNEWRMWKFCFELTNCDMAGDYTVTAKANDAQGGTGTLINTFEYLSIKELAIDFNTIDYGIIVPGAKQIVSGDTNFGTSNAPTVRNRANDPFKLRISATDMVGASDPSNKILATNLDAHVYGVDVPGGSDIDEEKNLDYDPGILFSPIIDPCTIEKIDFSLEQGTICSDSYTGTITLEPVSP